MLFSIITSFSTLQIPGLLTFHAGRDAWLSVIIAWFLDVLVDLLYTYMGIRFPGENFVQYSITILGKYFGKIVGAMFPIYFLIVASALMRAISILFPLKGKCNALAFIIWLAL
ncbi:GerAB/ArcD/ProY family transporter [Clostridium sp. OS1-26]|uniref:GerAB/ArcD/ProY family transporter n=1 Tax=Clostridium sp. OS1-26 TaxID=3070681 RepID=UPI0027E2158F|nr:GerAB/ArcD/ProY family transporter [Clostridium sp. OS1-26]WML33593.1 GerAB/ArcD/ProY family transporter [Clostridium sp. OS1-26]